MVYTKFYGPAQLFKGPHQMELQLSQREHVTQYIRQATAESLTGEPEVIAEKWLAFLAPETTWTATILWAQAEADEPTEVNLEGTQFGRAVHQRVRRFTIHVPVFGQPGLLTCANPAGPISYPRVDVKSLPNKSIDGELVFSYDDDGRGSLGVKERFERDRATIEAGYANLVGSFAQHRKLLIDLATTAIRERKVLLAQQTKDLSALGMPVRKRQP